MGKEGTGTRSRTNTLYTRRPRQNCLKIEEITAAEVLVAIQRTVPQWKAETLPRAMYRADF